MMISLLSCCSLAEQLESISESMDEHGISALNLFLECKKVDFLFLILLPFYFLIRSQGLILEYANYGIRFRS